MAGVRGRESEGWAGGGSIAGVAGGAVERVPRLAGTQLPVLVQCIPSRCRMRYSALQGAVLRTRGAASVWLGGLGRALQFCYTEAEWPVRALQLSSGTLAPCETTRAHCRKSRAVLTCRSEALQAYCLISCSFSLPACKSEARLATHIHRDAARQTPSQLLQGCPAF